ncbi:MAG: hypothetical protein C5B51_27340 [Terriglobia bacterium]|nr:MAG: hypothetical protein C5B51_27340 [Terriglobia bacterium]
MPNDTSTRFEKAAQERPHNTVFGELWLFIRINKKWWMIPIVITLLLFGVLILLAGTGAAPFIYTLF